MQHATCIMQLDHRQEALNILVNRAKRIALNSCVGESATESVA